jgi:hypothetical protein
VYLKKLRLQNIKCFEDVTLEFPHTNGDYSGWNVILGVNGSGKSTLLRMMVEPLTGLLGMNMAFNEEIVSTHADRGLIDCAVIPTSYDDPAVGKGRSFELGRALSTKPTTLSIHIHDQELPTAGVLNTPGWFACGYGPFRRPSRSPFFSNPLHPDRRDTVPFTTVFSDTDGLNEPFAWLRSLYGRSLDRKVANWGKFRTEFPLIIELVNQLMPDELRIRDVSTESIRFETRNGIELDAFHLSDGYRSFLALALDILLNIHKTTQRFGEYVERDKTTKKLSVTAEGIVLIDEADAHLHPQWQRELGERLCAVFPKIQFIVTTHSPFIAQEARDNGLFVLKQTESGAVVVEQPVESVRGWTASQILTSPLFGLDSTRSAETEALVREGAELSAKHRSGRKMTKAEKERLAAVRETLTEILSAPGETFDEMQRQKQMNDYVDATLKRLKNGKS